VLTTLPDLLIIVMCSMIMAVFYQMWVPVVLLYAAKSCFVSLSRLCRLSSNCGEG
jgi:hypothetical protein